MASLSDNKYPFILKYTVEIEGESSKGYAEQWVHHAMLVLVDTIESTHKVKVKLKKENNASNNKN